MSQLTSTEYTIRLPLMTNRVGASPSPASLPSKHFGNDATDDPTLLPMPQSVITPLAREFKPTANGPDFSRLYHLATVALSLNEPQVPCTHCPKRFADLPSMKKHYALAHVQRMFTCKMCGGQYPNRLTLTRHQLQDHK